MHLKVGSAILAANGAPSGATAGFPLRRGATGQVPGEGFYELSNNDNDLMVAVRSIAGSGVMTVTYGLWGYHTKLNMWFFLGMANGGVAIAETSADSISRAEGISSLEAFDRAYVEVTVVAGTNPSYDFYLLNRG